VFLVLWSILISATFFEVILDAFISYIKKSWTPKNRSVDPRWGTTALSPNHQFSQRIWYVEYYSVHAHMAWSQKFCKSKIWNEEESTHDKFFCNQAQNYKWKVVSSIAIKLFINLSKVTVLSIFWFSPVATGRILGAYPPQTKLQASPNWNVKHYKSVQFLLIFGVSSPPAETQSPPIENFLAAVLFWLLYKQALQISTAAPGVGRPVSVFAHPDKISLRGPAYSTLTWSVFQNNKWSGSERNLLSQRTREREREREVNALH